MNILKTSLLSFVLGLGVLAPAGAAGRHEVPNPDFTQGESIPEGATKDWTLGATGARGWMHSHILTTTRARQIAITQVAKGSPADGVLDVGDVLLGVAGHPFSYDPRVELGQALTAAEAVDGRLVLTRWRAGKTEQVTVPLPVLGAYSPTAPYDCPKSDRILEAVSWTLAERMQRADYKQNPIVRSLNALALLATGDPEFRPIVKKEAAWAVEFSAEHMAAWYYSYIAVFLSEYIMATGDDSVLPGLRRIALEAASGQSNVGSWGHKFADENGRLVGYGMMNSPGSVLTLGLVLAREAGVDDPEVSRAIDRSMKLLRFYIGKGGMPYGDHAPYLATHENNGVNGMVAVLHDQLGDPEGTEFFAKMSAAAHGSERDCGHTGNYFNVAWALPGVSRCGPQMTGAWMEAFGAAYFDLARGWDGRFRHQGPPKGRPGAYANWDATGVYLIGYALPRKAIRLTGKKASAMPPLDEAAARAVVDDGRGFSRCNDPTLYDALPLEALVERLSSWSPVVRERAATALVRYQDAAVEPVIALLDAPSLDARLGACQALARLGSRAQPAVGKLRALLHDDELWLRVKAAQALAVMGPPAMEAIPDLLEMAAKGPTAEDPRAMEQRFVSQTLFNRRSGLLGRSLEGVDQSALLATVRSGLHNQDGRTRGAFASVYANLSLDELRPILEDIDRAIAEQAPSGVMFCGQIQQAGLDLFSRHHVSEGIELLADYVRLQKPHGSEKTTARILDMLKRYGAHAQRAIPRLEKAIHYFEHEEKDFPRRLSLQKAEVVREAIVEIQAMTDKPELLELGLAER